MTADLSAAADTLRDELAGRLARRLWAHRVGKFKLSTPQAFDLAEELLPDADWYADAQVAAERERIARVEAECEKWERRAADGFPVEPTAIDYAKRLRRALGQS